MNIALQKTSEDALEQRVDLPVDIAWPDLQAAISGNLGKLSAEGQVKYYNALCKFTGLNPLGFPFEWISFQGKLRLYPKKECADQLRGVHKITAKIIERTFFDDICIVRVLSKTPDGREFESTGAVPYSKTMPVLDRCKALKVAETQAYRRGTFGLVGLGNLPDDDAPQSTVNSPQSAVEQLGEESVTSRVALLNQTLEEKPIEVVSEVRNPETDNIQQPTSNTQQPVVEAPTVPAAAPSLLVETSSNQPGGLLSDTEVEALQAVLSAYPDPQRAMDYLIYCNWCPRGKPLNFTKRNRYAEIISKQPAFFRLVDGWKGTL